MRTLNTEWAQRTNANLRRSPEGAIGVDGLSKTAVNIVQESCMKETFTS
jgi:hypothetical protein